jgi:hypothetical protein
VFPQLASPSNNVQIQLSEGFVYILQLYAKYGFVTCWELSTKVSRFLNMFRRLMSTFSSAFIRLGGSVVLDIVVEIDTQAWAEPTYIAYIK